MYTVTDILVNNGYETIANSTLWDTEYIMLVTITSSIEEGGKSTSHTLALVQLVLTQYQLLKWILIIIIIITLMDSWS